MLWYLGTKEQSRKSKKKKEIDTKTYELSSGGYGISQWN